MKKNSSNGNKSSMTLTGLEQQAIIDKQKEEIFYLKSIIRKLPGSVYWKNKEGVYLGCNDFVLGMAGTKEVVGKTDFDLPWKDYAQEICKTDKTVMETNGPIELEEHPTLASGQQIIMLTRKTPLKDEQDNTVGTIGISVDITDKKQQEEQKIAFLNVVSHEIRGPLTNIQGLLQAISFAKTFEKQAIDQVIDTAIKEVKRATGLLSDMVDLFDPDFIKDNTQHIDTVSLLEVIESITPEVRFNADTQFIVEINSNVPSRISINVLKLRNILKILLQNSSEQTQYGSIKLLINVIKVQNKPALYIELIDTSPGFYPENKDYIFNALGVEDYLDKDFLYHKPYIKLTMAKRLIESMEGTISLINHPNQGAEFEIVIPYQAAAEKAIWHNTPLKPISHRSNPVKIPTGLQILVVEDDKTTNQLLADIFKRFKCQVKQAYTGSEALTLLKQQQAKFDIISLDITLPDINGTQVLKKLPETQMDTVVAITSHATKADIDYFYEQGFMAVLTKPINQDEIQDLLEAYARMQQDD